MSVVQIPSDLQEIVDQLLAVEGEAELLVSALDDEQCNWSPAPGAWSIAQCLDHLNVSNARYFEAICVAVEEAQGRGWTRTGPIVTSWFGRRFIAMLEPPVRMKTRAPKTIRPAARRHNAEIWPDFVRQHTHMRACVEQWGDVDMNRARFRNPLGPYGVVRAGTGLRIIAAHDRRHLWQASRVRIADGFPRS
jgi:hypothetical protein